MKNMTEPGTPRAYIVDYLGRWRAQNRKISVLRYELEQCAHITPGEMIDVMNYSRTNDVDRTKIRTSNDPRYIAPNYRERAQQINDEIMKEISDQLAELEREQDRMDHYISLLDERGKTILKMYYLEGVTMTAIADKFYLTERTIERSKKRAIDELAEMYAFTQIEIPR